MVNEQYIHWLCTVAIYVALTKKLSGLCRMRLGSAGGYEIIGWFWVNMDGKGTMGGLLR